MKKINTDFKYLFSIWTFLILSIILTYAHHGHLLIDCGREVYYPTQILSHKVLYKDIFNIYGPFAYMLNAFLFKIFGINLNVLYFAGYVCAFLISSLIYLISNQFLSKFTSFSIAILTISIGVLNTNLFNFIFPYSYSMLYGFVSFLISIWFLFRYQSEPKNTIFLYLSVFFTGLCITSKYEFIPYFLVILYGIIKIKKLTVKEYYYTFFSFLFIPFFCFGVLFLQGLSFNDLILTAVSIKKMAQSETLNYFYHAQGVYFNKGTLGLLATNFIKTTISIGILILGVKIKRMVLSISVILLALFSIWLFINPASFTFLPILTIILILLNFKTISKDKKLSILIFACIAVDLKVIWSMATLNYGVFFTSFLIITILSLLVQQFKEKNINQNIFGIYILIVALIFAMQNINTMNIKSYSVQTSRGKIYQDNYLGPATSDLIEYINNNSKKSDTVVILPEATFINFLTDRKSDNYYNSIIPLYFEVFGEERIIAHFEKTKPEYIIFDNWDMSKDYYLKNICNDYAFKFCSFVAQNYTKEKTIDKGLRYLIFKKID